MKHTVSLSAVLLIIVLLISVSFLGPTGAQPALQVTITPTAFSYMPIVPRGWLSPPVAPTNVNASDGTFTDKVQVTWSGSSGATYYEVYRATSSGGSKNKLGNPTGTSYDDTTASPGATYYYWVKACSSHGCSAYSAYDTGRRGGSSPPAPSLNNINNPDGDGNYTVSWSGVSAATSYRLEEDDNAAFSSATTVYDGSDTSKSITGRDAGTYYYRVRASNAFGSSDWSSVKSVTVQPPPGEPERGYWEGQYNSFTVSADSDNVCGFNMWWLDSAPCGLLSSYSFPCTPINTSGRFVYESTGYYNITYEGDFTSSEKANGTWQVATGSCSADGTWSADFVPGAFPDCDQDGSVEICAWVNIRDPLSGESVVVYGQLLDNGAGRNGLPMHTVWHLETTTETCDSETGTDGDGLARCHVPTYNVSAGFTVVIDVTITYRGQDYTVSTSFTQH